MGNISVQGLGKKFKRYRRRWHRLAEWGTAGSVVFHQTFWALKGISFEVSAGESVGIIGQNGAGKSTLLKVLIGTTQPTEGKLDVPGDVSALLELGMGFHPDFTGRQNVYMQALLMGMSRERITDLMPEIEIFSELRDFMDEPLRVYSSGMVVRLAFSVATVVRPDILIVDEALSVGDAYFQYKCVRRIKEFREKGTTLLFVSHDASVVKTLCQRAILLDKGTMKMDDAPEKVMEFYNAMVSEKEESQAVAQAAGAPGSRGMRSGNFLARFESVEMVNEYGRTVREFRVGEEVAIRCRVSFRTDVDSPTIGILIRDRLGNDVFGTNSFYVDPINYRVKKGEQIEATFKTALNLGPGHYSLAVAVHKQDSHLSENFEWWDQAVVFRVIHGEQYSFNGLAFLPVKLDVKKETQSP